MTSSSDRTAGARRSATLSAGSFATASYGTHLATGVTVQTSVGAPRWLPTLSQFDEVKPFGLFGADIAWPEFEQRYRAMLDRRWQAVQRRLLHLTWRYDHVVLACFCRDPEECHRRILATVIEERTGLAVPEIHRPKPAHNQPSGGTGQL